MNNIHSGQIVYNKNVDEIIDLEFEVANIEIFSENTNFWVAITCWEGKVAFLNRPVQSQGRDFVNHARRRSSHSRDVSCVDITTRNHMVTGSIDNTICFWNSFNGQETKRITIPRDMGSP